jgi:hypothetical protein
VTGLTFTTDYTVAVYEYAGTGVDTNYLLTPLVEATQQTTDYAVHNYDFGIDCKQCHYHSAFGARETELKDICLGCHTEFGDADTKQEFDNHTTPNKNPAVDFVDCGVCHELHNHTAGGRTDTTLSFNSITSQTQHNKSFLRANVDKYISTAQTPAFLHTDQPKRVADNLNGEPEQPAITPERAFEGGNATTARGYCQVCHTLTNYHRNNAAATDPSGGGRPGLMQCHDGDQNTTCESEVHCGDCHEHNNRFQGVNANLPCEQCHDQADQGTLPIITTQFDRPGSRHIPGGSTDAIKANCVVCHDNHGHDGFVYGLDADDGTTKYASTTAGHDTLATGNGEAFAPHCLSCHDNDGAASLPPTGDQTPLSPFTGTGAPPIVDATLWGSASHNIPTPSTPSMTCVGDGTNGCVRSCMPRRFAPIATTARRRRMCSLTSSRQSTTRPAAAVRPVTPRSTRSTTCCPRTRRFRARTCLARGATIRMPTTRRTRSQIWTRAIRWVRTVRSIRIQATSRRLRMASPAISTRSTRRRLTTRAIRNRITSSSA